jgi:hypothetical protein
MSNQLDITIDQGSSLLYTFTLQDTYGLPYVLTSFDARLQVRRTYGDTSVLINCTIANSKLVLTNAAQGILSLVLAPADTSSIRFNSKDDDTLDCVYDLEIIRPDSKVYKPAKGAFVINREVTR